MHLHLPKPIHGWRGFIGEVGIIVIGILIALGAEEVLTEYNWSRKVEAGEAALTLEAKTSSSAFAEEMTVGPCLIAQIDALKGKVLAPDGPKNVVTSDSARGQQVIRAPSREFARDIWVSLLSDGTAAHMKAERRQSTNAYYAQFDQMYASLPETDALMQRLTVLAEPAPLDSHSRFLALSDLVQLRSRVGLQILVSQQLLATLRDLGRLPTTTEIDHYFSESKRSGTVAFCNQRHLPLGNWRQMLSEQPIEKVPEA